MELERELADTSAPESLHQAPSQQLADPENTHSPSLPLETSLSGPIDQGPNTAAVHILSDGNVQLRSTATDAVWVSDVTLITASRDGRVRVWDMQTGTLTTTFTPSSDPDDPIIFLHLLPASTHTHPNILTLSKKSRELKTWALAPNNIVTLCRSVTVPNTGKGFVVNVPVLEPILQSAASSPTSVKLGDDGQFAENRDGIHLDDHIVPASLSTGEEADVEVDDSARLNLQGHQDSTLYSKQSHTFSSDQNTSNTQQTSHLFDSQPSSAVQSGAIGDNEASGSFGV